MNTEYHESIVKRITKSLPNSIILDNKQCLYTDFKYNDKTYKVIEAKIVGVTRKYIELDFANDIQQTYSDMCCIAIEGESTFYTIPCESLWSQIMLGILNDKKNFKKIFTEEDIIRYKTENILPDIKNINITYDTFKRLKNMNSYEFKDNQIDIKEIQNKNKMVLQYEPLVNKITKQFVNKVQASWDDIKSMAWEGLVIAFNTYDKERSKMTFLQFAGFSIRNNILTSLDNELRTVKMSNYAQKKASEAGEPAFNSIRIDVSISQNDDERKPKEIKYGMYENEKFSDGDVYQYLYYRLDSEFSTRDCNIFYMTFGLKSYEETKGKDIARMFGISEGLVSQRLKKIITFIRKDRDLCEVLQNLLK